MPPLWSFGLWMSRCTYNAENQVRDIAGKLRPAFDRAVHSAVHDAARDALDDRLKSEGYDARQRGEIEDLVEKSK